MEPSLISASTQLDLSSIYRTIGLQQAERYGIGFMDKSGIIMDMDHRSHPAYVMVLVLRGRGTYLDAQDNSFQLTPGSCFQRFPGHVHTVTIDPRSHWLECFLEIGPSMHRMLTNCTAMNVSKPVLDVKLPKPLLNRLKRLHARFKDEADIKLLHALPELFDLALLLHASEQEDRRNGFDDFLVKACSYLTEDYQSPVNLPAFCRQHGWGYENFRKLFKGKLGVSPQQYRIRRRIDAACSLLACPELSIGELAHQLGYSSAYEFSAQFKRYIGCPPSLYLPRRRANNHRNSPAACHPPDAHSES